ncbi:chloramphenicol acetyltransferase [Chryseobacterium salipaludis]|uniref:chloramphenicol acetyltransferase n=1 Tax=Chryseobacterium TaxID=59732 RepID=UPI001FF6E1FD|nr:MULTISPECIES: chloramphenicol acetyltransferase [Chryseobacterium]MCJ8498754.1 chloramphenicol acetyltransferase [Chryseobacterium salipaludis]MCX3297322.1 chloramphenicol acetyltransferase [Planobacterium sp. JC490]
MKKIDVSQWNRKEHFEFFSKMASPYFGITTEVDCTTAYENAKDNGHSFFAHYFHKSMLAVNAVAEMKYRIVDGEVVVFDKINAGATVGRADGTFAFVFVNFSKDFQQFNAELQQEIKAVKNSTGLRLNDDDIKKDLIRYSTIPWSSFTALLHPTNLDKTESVPKITFGKFSVRDGRKYLPISIEAHHGLVDGFHLAQYLSEFQKELDR